MPSLPSHRCHADPRPAVRAPRRIQLTVAGLLTLATLTTLVGCSSKPTRTPATTQPQASAPAPAAPRQYFQLANQAHTQEMVIYALGLLGTGYKFGGRNPEAGLDCSGMVSFIVEQVSGRQLPHNAARIADMTRPIRVDELAPGDLVFFNTLNRRHSHMGIYMGDGKFVHAPSSRGQIRVERMDNPYFRSRIDGARSLSAKR